MGILKSLVISLKTLIYKKLQCVKYLNHEFNWAKA